jgi:Zinc-binding dehydrogenase
MALLSFKTRRAARRQGVRYSFLFMHASGTQLGEITKLIDSGVLRPIIDRTYTFDQAPQALAHVERGRSKGKVIITMVWRRARKVRSSTSCFGAASTRSVDGLLHPKTKSKSRRSPSRCSFRTYRLLALVTARQLGGAGGPNAALEHREARAHPGNILLLDWVIYSVAHLGWFQPDRLHLTLAGASAFTDLLASALPYAYVPCPGS